MEMDFHMWLLKATVSDVSGIYIYPSFLPKQNCSLQPPFIGGYFGGSDLSKYKGEVLILIFLEGG
jgi:hypothetical protein